MKSGEVGAERLERRAGELEIGLRKTLKREAGDMKKFFCMMTLALVVTIGGGCASAKSARSEKVANPLKVAVYADRGPSGIGAVEWWRLVHDSPEMELKLVDGAGVRAGALEGQDLLIMPGGSDPTEAKTLGPEGLEKMKAFIREGGAYLGTCAGCCLLMDWKDMARIVPWRTRGRAGDLLFPNFKVNAAGAKALGIKEGDHRMRYHGGPFLWPSTNVIEGAKFECWGTYNAQACFKGKANPQMHGAAGLIGGTYGKGRVFVTSGHPEYFPSTQYIVKGAIRWLTGREVTLPRHQRRPGDVAVGYYAALRDADGIATVRTMLALSDAPGVCLVPTDRDGIWEGRLRYLDAVVVPVPVKKGVLADLAAFQKRGGKILTVGSGNVNKIPGAIACASAEEILKEVRNIK